MELKYETPRLILRVCTRRDARMVYQFYRKNWTDFAKYEPIDAAGIQTLRYHETVLEMEEKLLQEKELVRFFLFERGNPLRVIGTLCFRDLNYAPHRKCCTVGYKLDRTLRNQGFMTEALRKGCEIMLDEEKLHRVEAVVMPDNGASRRLLEKVGFREEGLLRQYVRLEGKWKDHLIYGLIEA